MLLRKWGSLQDYELLPDGRIIGRLTEVQLLLVQDVLVEDDDTGAHGNPDTARAISFHPWLISSGAARLTLHRERGGCYSEEVQASQVLG